MGKDGIGEFCVLLCSINVINELITAVKFCQEIGNESRGAYGCEHVVVKLK